MEDGTEVARQTACPPRYVFNFNDMSMAFTTFFAQLLRPFAEKQDHFGIVPAHVGKGLISSRAHMPVLSDLQSAVLVRMEDQGLRPLR